MDMQLNECTKLLPDISLPTPISWYTKFRKVCAWSIERQPVLLDGEVSGNTIEIDESLFNKKLKYHKGRERFKRTGLDFWGYRAPYKKRSKRR